ncbi:hypothetical protein AMATHDRAFT_151392 [Amanita thiersii Skay4041]|uniref:Enoyl reductase (ER) domain-containing protein n=1 Tax=Amanita thiersii Skay4041 TaxID=703135 RepID=A0A2A9NCE0_9AGAR|nr:hypothetical protein AMATHDRAFT_151392 [Amanita thiersii Skay4041]
MPIVNNARLFFNEIPPQGLPSADSTFKYDQTETVDLDGVDLQGGILIKVIALSLDPYMRNRMRPVDTEGDMPAFELHQVVTGFGVGSVIRSGTPNYPTGAHVYGFMPFQQYAVFPDNPLAPWGMSGLNLKILENPHKLPWHYFLGVAGMSGQTAYYGLKDISSPKPGETLYVSAACGAVGHLIVQYAKSIGLKVIASCGSEEKVKILQGLGADHVFNHRSSDVGEELKAHGPIDIYFDNVGGPTLEAALENAAPRARFVICGMISQYNTDIIEGFIVIDWHEKYEQEFYEVVPREVSAGRIKYIFQAYHGLDHAAEAFLQLMTGGNVGKSVLILSDDAM